MLRIKKLDIFLAKQFGLLFAGTFFICQFVLMMQFLWRYVDDKLDFSTLLRSRKHNSLVLTQIFTEDEWNRREVSPLNTTCWSLTNYCLCRRWDADILPGDMVERVKWLQEKGYLPEMEDTDWNGSPFEFLTTRQRRLEEIVNSIWAVENIF